MSVNSKSMSKISDNASEGSFKQQHSNDGPSFKQKKKNMIYAGNFNMKKGPLATQISGGNFGDLKIENSKHQTFNSDFEDNLSSSVAHIKNNSNSTFVNN